MNAAARVIKQGDFFSGRISAIEWDSDINLLVSLIIALVISALAVVYVSNESRLACIELQQLEQQANAMQLHGGQLLLEQASLSSAARIEVVAMEQLQMHMPSHRSTVIIKL